MSNPYITLTTSNYGASGPSGPGLSLKFRVPEGGAEVILDPKQTMNTTLEGLPDIAQGGIYEVHQYTIRVRETEDETGYGDKADLETLFRLKNPNGNPRDVLTLVDHYGNSKCVIIMGKHVPKPQSVIIEGTNAYFLVPLIFQVVE